MIFLDLLKNVGVLGQNLEREANLLKQKVTGAIDPIAYEIAKGKMISPLAAQQPTPTPTPTVNPYLGAIEKGLGHWGGDTSIAPMFAESINKYDIYKQYPFLLPAISILETGGGNPEKIKQTHNILNWGINLPKGWFEPQSKKEVIEKTASGIAERMAGFEKFRETRNLEDLANVYAPEVDNPLTGGKKYAKNLKKVMDVFQSYYGRQN